MANPYVMKHAWVIIGGCVGVSVGISIGVGVASIGAASIALADAGGECGAAGRCASVAVSRIGNAAGHGVAGGDCALPVAGAGHAA